MPGNFTKYAVNNIVMHSASFDAYTAGQYIVTATDANSCSNSDTLVIFNSCPDIFIPNLITPNADHKNDYFCIEGLLPNCTLEIYNSWGNLVYRNSDYNNDWNGEGVNDGVYYYTFTSPYYKKSWKGWVQVMR